MLHKIWRRVLEVVGWFRGGGSPGAPRDPFARKPAPVTPKPRGLTGSVALAEPDDEKPPTDVRARF
ncbi:MAG: hypothetical protein DMF91_16850 [Acidobacteria bacterium]|nr:MAG: hypothetical protein DMF91_16850 [Acidobacteriota bacterium]